MAALPVGIAAIGKFFERGKFFFGSATGIVEFVVAVVADEREIVGVEEGAVVGELGAFVAVAEAARPPADVEAHLGGFAGLKRLVERVDGIYAARTRRHLMECTIERDRFDALERVGDVYLVDGLVGFVLQ